LSDEQGFEEGTLNRISFVNAIEELGTLHLVPTVPKYA